MNMKKVRIITIYIFMILAVLTAVFAAGCRTEEIKARNTAELYIDALKDMDFDRAYDYVCRRCGSISLEDYVDAWDNIISVLKVTDIGIDGVHVESDGDTEYLCYRITLTSERVDTVSSEVRAKMTYYEGESHVDFTYDSILTGYAPDTLVRERVIKGVRGEIFAEDGTVLAENSYADTVYISVSKDLDIGTTLGRLSDTIEDLDLEKLRRSYDSALEKDYAAVTVKSYGIGTMDEALRERLGEIDGIGIDDSSMTYQRYYPYGRLFANIIGYTGVPSEAQLEEFPYTAKTGVVGKTGLESAWEETLHAEDGYSIEFVNSAGTIIKVLKHVPAVNGKDLRTSLNIADQTRAHYALEKYLNKDQTGCAIVMDTKLGFMSAMASNPSYDSNVFASPIDDETYEELFGEDSKQPLLNRATQVTLAPGSTIKPFTAAAAIDSGTLHMSSVFPYEIEDNKWLPNDPNWIWPPISRNDETMGVLNMFSAIRSSDNIYFGWAAMKMGDEKFLKYFRENLHFDESFPFDLPLKKGNLVNEKTQMTPKLLSDMGFGVGEVLVSPVQLISYYTCFENGGDVLQPRIIKSITESDGISETTVAEFGRTVLYEDVMFTHAREQIYDALLEVVNTGTAHVIHDRKKTIAAKTGTAVVSNTREIAWIVAFFTDMSEDRMILVMVDGPSDLGDVKFNIANELLEVRELD